MGEHCCGSHKKKHDHFEGKSAYEHLKEARVNTAHKLGESHRMHTNSPWRTGLMAGKSTCVLYLMLFTIIIFNGPIPFQYILTMSCGWLVWQAAYGAYQAWVRLQKLHRVIDEERYEIATNREQEREELIEIYRLKGFEGALLDQVIDVLMADDNRLLNVMLEDELGLKLESYEHPIKHAMASALFVAGSITLFSLAYIALPYGIPITAFILFGIFTYFLARRARTSTIQLVVWNMASITFAVGVAYYAGAIVRGWFG